LFPLPGLVLAFLPEGKALDCRLSRKSGGASFAGRPKSPGSVYSP